MLRSTAHRLRIRKSATGSSVPSLSPSSETQPLTGMSDYTSDAKEDSCTKECDIAERKSARGSYYGPRIDWPFLEFATPLGNGTSFSAADVLLLTMDHAIEEGLAWSSIKKLLKLQNRPLGMSCLPESKYLFRKFSSASPELCFSILLSHMRNPFEEDNGHLETDRTYHPHARCVGSSTLGGIWCWKAAILSVYSWRLSCHWFWQMKTYDKSLGIPGECQCTEVHSEIGRNWWGLLLSTAWQARMWASRPNSFDECWQQPDIQVRELLHLACTADI